MKIGKTIGVSVMLTVTIYCILGLPYMEPQVRNNFVGVTILGVVIGCLSLLYNTNLSLLTVSLIHFSGSLITFLAVAYFGKWFPFKLEIVAGSTAVFLIIFLLIWTVFYFGDKKKIDKINQKLK